MFYSAQKMSSHNLVNFPSEDHYIISNPTKIRLNKEAQKARFLLRRNKRLAHYETTLGSSPKYRFDQDYSSQVYKALTGRARPVSLFQLLKTLRKVQLQRQAAIAKSGGNGGNGKGTGENYTVIFKSYESQVKPSSSKVNSSVPKKLKLVREQTRAPSQSNSLRSAKPKSQYKALSEALLATIEAAKPEAIPKQHQPNTVKVVKTNVVRPPQIDKRQPADFTKANDPEVKPEIKAGTSKQKSKKLVDLFKPFEVGHEVEPELKQEVFPEIIPEPNITFASKQPSYAEFSYGVSKMHNVHKMLMEMYQEETQSDMESIEKELEEAKEKSIRRYNKLRRLMNDSTTEILDLFR